MPDTLTETFSHTYQLDRSNHENPGMPEFMRFSITADQVKRIADLRNAMLRHDAVETRIVDPGIATYYAWNDEDADGEPSDSQPPMGMNRAFVVICPTYIYCEAYPFRNTQDVVRSPAVDVALLHKHFPDAGLFPNHGARVTAFVDADRTHHAARFDATDVLRMMSDDDLIQLAKDGWRQGDDEDPLMDHAANHESSDSVTRFMEDMAELIEDGKEATWTVTIPADVGLAFVDRERPAIFSQVKTVMEQRELQGRPRRAGPR